MLLLGELIALVEYGFQPYFYLKSMKGKRNKL